MAPSGASDTPEKPDTTSIRAEWYAGMNIMDAKDCIRALCDALDAARAREERCTTEHAPRRLAVDLKARAEAAEATEEDLESACESYRKQVRALDARAEAAEENLTFAQQRAADNGLRAEIGERKITELVAEIRDLNNQLSTVRIMCRDAVDDWSEGQVVLGENILNALGETP